MKFYPADWRADAMLRLCSIGARGLWAEMMCIMHAADNYGSLLVNGKRIDKKQLAGLAGISEKECIFLLLELETNGVFSRDEDGTIYSRRMRRDHAKAIKDKENGRGGGNPTLKAGVNPPVNPTVNGGDKAQKPEARSQKLEAKKDLESVRAKRATRLPDDWVPSEADKLFAFERGMSVEATKTEATKFRNYWTAKGGQGATKTNWERTWQNWILNSNGAPNGNRSANSRTTGHDAIFAAAAREARKIVGDGDMAGPADEAEFPIGPGPDGGTARGRPGSFGATSAGDDGRKPFGVPIIEGEVIAPDQADAGLPRGWRVVG
jgi:hypothetical protein